MYHTIVKRILQNGYRQISHAEFAPLLRQFAPTIHFTFSGDHALDGDFHQRETVRQWFERIHRLFPDLEITARHMVVSGMPGTPGSRPNLIFVPRCAMAAPITITARSLCGLCGAKSLRIT